MRILLIEDHPPFALYIRQELEKAGFTVDSLGTLSDGEAAMEAVGYDAVILDLGLPDGDGLTLLQRTRKRGNPVPILILTGRDAVKDRVRGLNAGADDYLTKPFAMEELVARVRALLRRPVKVSDVALSAGNLVLETTAREVRINDRPIAISRREMAVLEQLLRRRGRAVPKEVIQEAIYGFDNAVTSNSVEVLVSRLRKRLKAARATVVIHTRRGVGYLLSDDDR